MVLKKTGILGDCFYHSKRDDDLLTSNAQKKYFDFTTEDVEKLAKTFPQLHVPALYHYNHYRGKEWILFSTLNNRKIFSTLFSTRCDSQAA